MRAVRSRPEAQAWTTPALQSAALHCCTLPRCSQSAKEGGGSKGGTEQCACCCSVELIYTTRFDTSVITHRGLIRCSSGSEGTSGRQRAGQGKGKGWQSGRQKGEDRHMHKPKTLQRDAKDRKQNKQTNNNKEGCCVSV
jgi:hypothetical protein